MEYIIWGCGRYGMLTKRMLEEVSGSQCVVAFADNDLSKLGSKNEGIPVISVWKLVSEYKECRVLIPGGYGETSVRNIVEQLLQEIKEEQIFVVPFNSIKMGFVKSIEELLCPLEQWSQIDNLGIKLANHCNLNCIRCNNFSNISEENFYLAEELEKDLEQLKSLIPNVLNVKLIGGEPLLSRELSDCIKICRQYYPYANMTIVTNGLLIRGLKEEQLTCIRDNDVKIAMTLYPALQNRVDEIVDFLRSKGIVFRIYRSGNFFIPILNEEGKYNPQDIRLQDDKIKCVSFFKGDICRCTVGLNIPVYNKRFCKNYPADGIHNIYEEGLTGKKLMEMLDEPIELCRYCNGCFTLNEKQYGKLWTLGEAHADDWLEG